MAGSSGTFAVRVRAPELPLLMTRMIALGKFFTEVVASVRPEFGAYMRYSPILEARHPKAKGHIANAITYNRDYITSQMQSRIVPIAVRYARTGSSRAGAKKAVEDQWEIVLNSKPRFDAMSNAPVMYGFHRSTIRGYGKERLVSEIRAQQERLHAERRAVRSGSGTKRRLSSYSRYGR